MTQPITYDEFKKLQQEGYFKKDRGATTGPTTIDASNYESNIPEGDRLKKKDLYNFKNLNTIRNYKIFVVFFHSLSKCFNVINSQPASIKSLLFCFI